MWIPFSKEISATFESDRRLPLKLAAGALVGLSIGLWSALRLARDNVLKDSPPLVYVSHVCACIVLCTAVVGVLALRDAIRKRIAAGKRVNVGLRFALASGIVSMMFWFALVVVSVLAITIAIT